MTWSQALYNSNLIASLCFNAWLIGNLARNVSRDICARVAHSQQLAYIAGWNAAHEQIRRQLMDAGMVVQMNDDVSETHTVH